MKLRSQKNYFKEFLLEESGQTTTEYILILAVVVTMIMQFKKRFKTIMDNLLGRVDDQTSDIFDE